MQKASIRRRDSKATTRSTLLLVLATESALLGTLVMAYLYLRTNSEASPFPHISSLDILIASLNTLLLLFSTVVARRSERAVAAGRTDLLKKQLAIVLILGGIFIAGQVFEFNHSGMQIDDSAFGGVFFALIGFHGLHVIAGMSLLGINLARARLGDFTARRHDAISAGTWFWYYVAAVWLILFIVLYVI